MHFIKEKIMILFLFLMLTSIVAQTVKSPSKLYHLRNAQGNDEITLFWNDNSTNETGQIIESRTDSGGWEIIDIVNADSTNFVINSIDQNENTYFRLRSFTDSDTSDYSEIIKIIGSNSDLEVYPIIPGIIEPKDSTIDGITFGMIQDQSPAEPEKGKATRLSTFFRVEVKAPADEEFLFSPVYETRPQIRNNLSQNDPLHTGGHRPYAYGNYGPNSNATLRKMHSRHWTNFDASVDIVVRVHLLSTANFPGPIDMADLSIQPEPINVTQINDTTIEMTLNGEGDYTKHYRVAVNKTAWSAISGRSENIFEAPLFIFVNPIHIPPGSAPENEIKEFNYGELVIVGPGIHLPDNNYRFFGSGHNDVCREMYAPGDSYLHYGFLFKNSYDIKVWGRAIYSDEMFNVYLSSTDYKWSDPNRTPWAAFDCAAFNRFGVNPPWEARVGFYGYSSRTATFDGFTNIGTRMGPVNEGADAQLINHKDVGYGGGTYQTDVASKTLYYGCMLVNDDDITYAHHEYTMNYCTSFNLINGPTFQYGWGISTEYGVKSKIYNHNVLESDRSGGSTTWKNRGVFNSRLKLGELQYHNGGLWENLTVWGQDDIVFNVRIWEEDQPFNNTISIFEDKIYKNITIKNHARNDNLLWGDQNIGKNQKSYLRFLHFENLSIDGNLIRNIDDGDYFDYNEGVLLHTITFFELPEPIAEPDAGIAPVGESIRFLSEVNKAIVQMDNKLSESLGPLCANAEFSSSGFTIVDAGDGYIALKAANGYYVKADKRRYGYLYTQPDKKRGDNDTKEITENSKFKWVDLENNTFALYSKTMGLYVRTEENSGPEMPLYAASNDVTKAETFIKIDELNTSTIPALFEAENYIEMSGIEIVPTTDSTGESHVTSFNQGDWIELQGYVSLEGEYSFNYRINSAVNKISFSVFDQDNIELSFFDVPATGSDSAWITISDTLYLYPGLKTFRITAVTEGWNINWLDISFNLPLFTIVASADAHGNISPSGEILVPQGSNAEFSLNSDDGYKLHKIYIDKISVDIENPFIFSDISDDRTIHAAFGTDNTIIVEAENYVSMEGIQTQNTADHGGGQNVGWVDINDWMTYTVNLPGEGEYDVDFRVASAANTIKIEFRDSEDNLIDTISTPTTSNWQNWKTVTIPLFLEQGVQTFKVFAKDGGWNLNWIKFHGKTITDVLGEGMLPAKYSLSNNYPNPFNPSTIIQYSVPKQSKVSIKVFDLLGREIMKLVDEVKNPGIYKTELNASELSSGIYFYRLQADEFVETKKMIYLK